MEETEAASAKDDSGPDWFTAAIKRRSGEERAREWRKELRRLQQEEARVTQLKERRKNIKVCIIIWERKVTGKGNEKKL